MTISVCTYVNIFLSKRIRTHPQTQSRLIVSRTIVVHTCLLVKLLSIKKIRRVPRIVALFYEHLTKRHILNVLRYFTIQVGDVATASQMVGVVVELHLLVVIIRLEVTICSSCACPCLCHLRCAVVTAELLCKREESELAQAFPSAADNVF